MSNDPLPLPDGSAEPRKDAEYEAVHATIAATARGRAFLTEYISRQRQSETRKLADTIARLESAMRDHSPVPAAFTRGVAELVAAIEQIETMLVASASATPDVHFELERIQDISGGSLAEAGADQHSPEDRASLQSGAERLDNTAARSAADPIAARDEHLSDEHVSDQGVARPPPEFESVIVQELPETQAAVGSREDPRDSFQPLSLPMPSPIEGSGQESQATETTSPSARRADASSATSASLNDPLAALHALSEEELIALFS